MSLYVMITGPTTILIESAESNATSRFTAHPDLVELDRHGRPVIMVPEGAVARIYPDEWTARWVVSSIHGTAGDVELDRWVDDGGDGSAWDAG